MPTRPPPPHPFRFLDWDTPLTTKLPRGGEKEKEKKETGGGWAGSKVGAHFAITTLGKTSTPICFWVLAGRNAGRAHRRAGDHI